METTFTLPNDKIYYPFCDLLFDSTHVLIGGTTRSGKSVLIDDFICHLISKYTPFALRFVLIDPKKVSLAKYKGIPHVERYADENADILGVLDDVIATMDKRYKDMQSRGIYLYDGSYIVIIIDELADLMTTCEKEIMPRLQRIAQLGGASRIKLICATQRPSRKTIPADLVVNFTGRLALRCLSSIESVQLICRKGAESLPQHGKALYLHADGKYYECKIPFTSDENVDNLIRFWKNQNVKPLPCQKKLNNPVSSVKARSKFDFKNLFALLCAFLLTFIILHFI